MAGVVIYNIHIWVYIFKHQNLVDNQIQVTWSARWAERNLTLGVNGSVYGCLFLDLTRQT